LKVVADMPELGQGETAEKPMPAPNATSNKVNAAAVTPPAMTAAQETAEGSFAVVLDAISALDRSLIMDRSGMFQRTTTKRPNKSSSRPSPPGSRGLFEVERLR
jgi:hypothetical protein